MHASVLVLPRESQLLSVLQSGCFQVTARDRAEDDALYRVA